MSNSEKKGTKSRGEEKEKEFVNFPDRYLKELSKAVPREYIVTWVKGDSVIAALRSFKTTEIDNASNARLLPQQLEPAQIKKQKQEWSKLIGKLVKDAQQLPKNLDAHEATAATDEGKIKCRWTRTIRRIVDYSTIPGTDHNENTKESLKLRYLIVAELLLTALDDLQRHPVDGWFAEEIRMSTTTANAAASTATAPTPAASTSLPALGQASAPVLMASAPPGNIRNRSTKKRPIRVVTSFSDEEVPHPTKRETSTAPPKLPGIASHVSQSGTDDEAFVTNASIGAAAHKPKRNTASVPGDEDQHASRVPESQTFFWVSRT